MLEAAREKNGEHICPTDVKEAKGQALPQCTHNYHYCQLSNL